MKAQQTNYVG